MGKDATPKPWKLLLGGRLDGRYISWMLAPSSCRSCISGPPIKTNNKKQKEKQNTPSPYQKNPVFFILYEKHIILGKKSIYPSPWNFCHREALQQRVPSVSLHKFPSKCHAWQHMNPLTSFHHLRIHHHKGMSTAAEQDVSKAAGTDCVWTWRTLLRLNTSAYACPEFYL